QSGGWPSASLATERQIGSWRTATPVAHYRLETERGDFLMKGHCFRSAAILVTALAASQFSARTARAQDAAYSFSTAPTSVQTPLSLGFLFTANQDLTIVSLGYYDDTAEGFVTAHTVGIFDSTGTLMVSATLDAGADAVLD